MPQQTSSMVLRLFGPTRTRVTAIMKQAADKGCPGLNLLMKDGEFAVCVTARADTEELAAQECTRWEHYFRQKMGQAIFSMDEHGLEETTLKTLMEKQKLFVAADEVTGRILNGHLTAGPLADAVYDFGKQSYDNPKFSNKIRPDKKLTRKYPGQLLQQAAGIAQSARRESDADWSVLYHPKDETTPAFVLLCDKKEVCVRVLPASAHPDNLASSWMLDMLRRMALNYAMEPEVESFQYGDPAPCLLPQVAEEPEQPDVADDPEKPRLKSHAEALYDDDPDEEMEPLHCRTHWGRLILCMLIVAAVVAGAFYWKHQWGRQPVAGVMIGRATYGTADFDTEAGQLLSSAQSRQEGVVAYLALPQMPGALVYGPGVSPGQTSGPVAYADQDSLVRCGAQVQPGQSRANFLVSCPETAMKQLSGLDDQDRLAQNSGFTLYTEQETYRYKTAAVFYWDPAETGEAALDLEGLQQLDNYQDYLTFVLGIKARSLFSMPVNVQDGDSFATLITDSDQDGGKLVITGRLLRDNEPAILFGRQIEAADEPLMPASRYAAGQAPDLATLERYWLNWYVTDGATSSEIQQEAGMPEEDRPLAEVGGGEPVVPDETEKPEPSAIPEVEKEEESLEPSAKPSAKPSATPTAKPTEQPQPSKVPAVKPTAAPTVAPTPMPTAAPTPAPESTQQPPAGKTIAVTMNGVPQEMDLVECLAMVARNELGPNAPAEAYKAQMVATHSWILNHGGFPSVAGRQPSESIRALAREVADQVLTYNGSVAFTPYFASAAFGTNSSQEVWGGARPYLIAVESPYDKDYASNWQNTRVYYRNEVLARGRDRLGVDLNAYSENPADWFGDLVKNSSGYVTSMRVGDKTISGKYLREKVLNDVNGKTLRSAAFDIEYDAAADAFRITTYGYGHGCGMSQMGAWGYAANGWNYADILAHYYPGTTLTQQ